MTLINYVPIVIAIILFFLILTIFKINCRHQEEGWVNYVESKYGNIHNSSQNPVVFYDVKRYRKPYRWPVCMFTYHPVPHCKHYN